MAGATLTVGILTLLVTSLNYYFNIRSNEKRFKLDSYVILKTKRLDKFEDAVINYTDLTRKYVHIRFTLWEQSNNKEHLKDFKTSDLNKVNSEREVSEKKILMNISKKDDSKKIINKIDEINKVIYNLPNQFKLGNEKKAHQAAESECKELIDLSSEYVDQFLDRIKNFSIKDL